MNTLKEILDHKRAEVAGQKERTALLNMVEALADAPQTVSLIDAIRSHEFDELSCIAEIKKASPSKGNIVKSFHPEKIAT